jgi:(2Fe-2S) ferredoxin
LPAATESRAAARGPTSLQLRMPAAPMHRPPAGRSGCTRRAPNPDMSYYKHHIFFCLNERSNGEACCAQHQPQQALDHCKARVKAAGLAGPGGVRVNKAGCLDRCAGGPVAVVYPEAVWYTYVDQHDIDEIVDSHLKQGRVVERLLLPPEVGR